MIWLQAAFALWPAAAPAQQMLVPERARDPWTFRCVLDERPRTVVLALSKEMWLAYDAQTCTFVKAWKGGVHFGGAVYDSVHGPQPTSFGDAYQEGLASNVWSAEVDRKEVPVRTKWLGYQHESGHVHLNCEVYLPDGRHMRVQETPEFVSTDSLIAAKLMTEDQMLELGLVEGMPGLHRSYAVDAIPDGVVLLVRVPLDGAVMVAPYPPDQLQRDTTAEELNPRGERVMRRSGYLPFAMQRVKVNLTIFFDPLPDAPSPDATDPKPR